MCPCLKQPQFVVGEAATSFQDVHGMFFSDFHTQCLHKNKIQKQISAAPVPNFYQTATGSTGIFLLRLGDRPQLLTQPIKTASPVMTVQIAVFCDRV